MPMESYLIWLVAGFVLVIAELVTTTFYLLLLLLPLMVGPDAAALLHGLAAAHLDPIQPVAGTLHL